MPVRPTDPVALAAWGRALLGQIHGLEDRIGNDFYSIGERLNALHPKEVYRALGYRTFGQLVVREKLWSRYWATALVGIVKALKPEQARTLGPTKCWWLIRYAATKGAKADELLEGGAPIGGNGTPVHELTARELQALAAQERARRKGLLGTPAHRDAEAARRLVSRTVRARGAKDPQVRLLLRGESWRIRIEVRAEDAVAASIGPELARRAGEGGPAAKQVVRRRASRGPRPRASPIGRRRGGGGSRGRGRARSSRGGRGPRAGRRSGP